MTAATVYVSPADFRPAALAEYCEGYPLTDEEASDTKLSATIERMSRKFDSWTNDRYVTEADVELTLQGNGTTILDLPRRCTAVTTVEIVNNLGVVTAQATTTYRLHTSLDAAGADLLSDGALDWLELVPGRYLAGTSYGSGGVWPSEPGSVIVTGDFGWIVPPPDVQRAVALLCYHQLKPIRNDLRLAQRVTTANESVDYAFTTPSGLPEVDEIVASRLRPAPLAVA